MEQEEIEKNIKDNPVSINMKRVGVSQGLAYQQPMDDSGQEHHPMLLNDGREVPKLLQPDGTSYGGVDHFSFLQRFRQQLNQAQNIYIPAHPCKQQQPLKLSVSRATRVLEPPSPSPEVILIDSDDEEEDVKDTLQLTQDTKPLRGTQPTSPAPNHAPFSDRKFQMSKKVVSEEEDPVFDFGLWKPEVKECENKVVDPNPLVIDSGQLGIQMRTGGINDLNEILELMKDIGEIVPKERKKCYEKGKVVDGEKEALVELLNNQEKLNDGITGVICTELECSRYEEYNEGHFTVMRQLGTGSFGSVDLCRDCTSEKQFVLKKVHKDFKVAEVVVLLYLEHENITSLYGYIKREGISEILMEYAGMNLLNFVLKRQTVEEQIVWSITRQGLSALKYLDVHQIKHLDLKPENICITDNMVVKLTDFGSAKMAMQPQDYQGWTSEYMAPEMCRSFLHSRYPNLFKDDIGDFSLTGKVDVFALGLVIQFMVERTHTQMKFYTDGAPSYRNVEDPNKLRLNIIIANARDPDMVLKMMLIEKASIPLKELLKGLLQGVPKNRLSAEQALLKIEAMERKKMIPVNPTPDAKDEVTASKLGSFHRRRTTTRQLSTMTSICSNTSQFEEPMSPGPMKGRRKGRKRMFPYDPDDNKPIAVDDALLGNVPDFSVLQA